MQETIEKKSLMIAEECQRALQKIDEEQSQQLVEAILNADEVFFIGVGRVMLSLQAICKRFAHFGIKAHCVGEITEPAITDKDLLIVGSGSGETLFPVAIAQKAKKIGTKVAWIGSNQESTIAKLADYKVRIPVQSKLNKPDELHSQQPMTSLFEQTLLLYGDSLAMEIMERKGLQFENLWKYHANLE
ncbi:SIS domain-containing protein [Clostridiaceae bacterium Marseille-Q4145]|nr:SIS domain-containing protein [Clostridiaceae bacterium Marseille-Q4145]